MAYNAAMNKILAKALFSRVRHSVLSVLFSSPEISLHLREIARLTNFSAATVRLELDSLTAAGILTDERKGNQRFFLANRQCPVFDELCSIVKKTSAIANRGLLEEMSLKYIWWLSPKEASYSPFRVLAQVMNIGTFEDVYKISTAFGDTSLKDVITHAQPGQFDKKSWSYWHYRLGLADTENTPPLPVRTFA